MRKAKGEDEYEYVPLEKGEQVGPGGLDPAEVFDSLPREMQEAFGERDVDALRRLLEQMPPDEAQLHMKRCIDSGLWDPQGAGSGGSDEAEESMPPADVDLSPSAEVDD